MSFTAREFTKYGFERDKESDFINKEIKFAVYKIDELKIAYSKQNQLVYIQILINYDDYNLTQDEWQARYEETAILANEFNGVSEDKIDMNKLIENCQLIKKALQDVKHFNDEIDMTPLINHYDTIIMKGRIKIAELQKINLWDLNKNEAINYINKVEHIKHALDEAKKRKMSYMSADAKIGDKLAALEKFNKGQAMCLLDVILKD